MTVEVLVLTVLYWPITIFKNVKNSLLKGLCFRHICKYTSAINPEGTVVNIRIICFNVKEVLYFSHGVYLCISCYSQNSDNFHKEH
jgi:hypothetical protein